MEYAVLLTIVGAVAVGVVAAVARTWSLHSRLYSLEDRLAVLESVQQREVKIRASAERWNKPKAEDLAIAAALQAQPAPAQKLPWYKSPNLKRGAYAP